MKRIVSISIVMFLVFSSLTSFSQKTKFGHIDSNKLFTIMPEKEQATQEVQKYAKELEDQLAQMQAELQKKYEAYQALGTDAGDLVKQTKEKELQDLNQRIQTFSQTAQQDLSKKEQDLLKPIYDKIKAAIQVVGEKGSYTYVYDASTLLYINKNSNDLFEAVKTELGIK